MINGGQEGCGVIKKIEIGGGDINCPYCVIFSMDISTDVAKKYIPGENNDLVKMSHIYTFYDDCVTNVRNYVIPFARDITWTQFRFVYSGSSNLRISLMLRDETDRPPVTLHMFDTVAQRNWHTLPWIIPSSVSNRSSLYFQVYGFEKGQHVRFDVLGFEGIKQSGGSYAFIDFGGRPVFVVKNDEYMHTNGIAEEEFEKIYWEV